MLGPVHHRRIARLRGGHRFDRQKSDAMSPSEDSHEDSMARIPKERAERSQRDVSEIVDFPSQEIGYKISVRNTFFQVDEVGVFIPLRRIASAPPYTFLSHFH